jgi:hypothetical protein
MFGLDSRSELRTCAGRIDTLVETLKYVYCFEFKLNHGGGGKGGGDTGDGGKQYTAKDALDQIESKDYLTPWVGTGKKLYKAGVVFDFTKRNITEWEILPQ